MLRSKLLIWYIDMHSQRDVSNEEASGLVNTGHSHRLLRWLCAVMALLYFGHPGSCCGLTGACCGLTGACCCLTIACCCLTGAFYRLTGACCGLTGACCCLTGACCGLQVTLYLCDNELTPWTQRCIRQADCILIVALAERGPSVGKVIPEVLTHWIQCCIRSADCSTVDTSADREDPPSERY